MYAFFKIQSGKANNVDPDQTAPLEAVWSGSAQFAYAILPDTFLYQILEHLLYIYFCLPARSEWATFVPVHVLHDCYLYLSVQQFLNQWLYIDWEISKSCLFVMTITSVARLARESEHQYFSFYII